jgi:hypothetical protein
MIVGVVVEVISGVVGSWMIMMMMQELASPIMKQKGNTD